MLWDCCTLLIAQAAGAAGSSCRTLDRMALMNVCYDCSQLPNPTPPLPGQSRALLCRLAWAASSPTWPVA